MEQGHCIHPSPPGAAAEPLVRGCGEPSQGPSVLLGSFKLPTEQTVIRKWGDQQQAQGCVYTEHRLPRRALHTDLFALCFFMGHGEGEPHKYQCGAFV